MEEENNRIVETLLGLSGASDEHMEEVLSAIPLFTERNMLSEWDGLPVKQWEEQDLYPKDDARPVRMHPSSRAKRTFDYYCVSDIEEVQQTEEEQVRMTIRVDAEVKRNLQRQAKELDMSVSEYIALLVMHPCDEDGETE